MRIQRYTKKALLLTLMLACAACSQTSKSEAPGTKATSGVATPVAVATSAKAQSPQQPEFYVGLWEPISNSYQGMGNLRMQSPNGFHWHKCKTTYVEQPDPPQPGMLLALSPDSTCVLDDQPHTRVKFVRVAKPAGKCDLTVSAYTTLEDARGDRPASQGTYSRVGCK